MAGNTKETELDYSVTAVACPETLCPLLRPTRRDFDLHRRYLAAFQHQNSFFGRWVQTSNPILHCYTHPKSTADMAHLPIRAALHATPNRHLTHLSSFQGKAPSTAHVNRRDACPYENNRRLMRHEEAGRLKLVVPHLSADDLSASIVTGGAVQRTHTPTRLSFVTGTFFCAD